MELYLYSPYVFMARYLLKHRGNFAYTLTEEEESQETTDAFFYKCDKRNFQNGLG
jgi:hypothetical protein